MRLPWGDGTARSSSMLVCIRLLGDAPSEYWMVVYGTARGAL